MTESAAPYGRLQASQPCLDEGGLDQKLEAASTSGTFEFTPPKLARGKRGRRRAWTGNGCRDMLSERSATRRIQDRNIRGFHKQVPSGLFQMEIERPRLRVLLVFMQNRHWRRRRRGLESC